MTNDRTNGASNRHSGDDSSSLEQRAQALLQESAEELDGRTRSRLTQARHAALDAVQRGTTHRSERSASSWWLPASAAAAAAVLTVMVSLNSGNGSREQEAQASLAPVDELEIV